MVNEQRFGDSSLITRVIPTDFSYALKKNFVLSKPNMLQICGYFKANLLRFRGCFEEHAINLRLAQIQTYDGFCQLKLVFFLSIIKIIPCTRIWGHFKAILSEIQWIWNWRRYIVVKIFVNTRLKVTISIFDFPYTRTLYYFEAFQ